MKTLYLVDKHGKVMRLVMPDQSESDSPTWAGVQRSNRWRSSVVEAAEETHRELQIACNTAAARYERAKAELHRFETATALGLDAPDGS